MTDQVQSQRISLPEITQMAQGIAQRLNYDGEISNLTNTVVGNAEVVKQHEQYIMQKLSAVTAGLLDIINRSAGGLQELREAITQIDRNAISPTILEQINTILMRAPKSSDIKDRITNLRNSMSANGISDEDIDALLPIPSVEELPLLTGEQSEDGGVSPGQEQQSVPPTANAQQQRQPNSGGKRRTKKRGGYGWRGKKGVEVRTSIRTTRRTKGKKGNKSSSGNKKTKMRSN
jgi:hypothetical protein